jgi:hypothetical protein
MDRAQWIGLFVIIGLVAFQVWVTFKVWRAPFYEKSHKIAQSKLIWLLPALGAVFAFSVLVDEEQAERRYRNPPTDQP